MKAQQGLETPAHATVGARQHGRTKHQTGADGSLQVLPPSASGPGLGVAEFAGFVGPQLLVAREAISPEGKTLRRFEVYGPELLQPQRWAGEFTLLGAFQRGVDAAWRAGSPLAR